MSDFLTRVELHAATRENYDRLHELMRGAGFSTVILGSDGYWHQLPTAEYSYSGNATIEAVRKAAADCAAAVVPKYAVIVAAYTSCAWIGLAVASKAA